MSRTLTTLLGGGFLALGLLVASPQTSQAQTPFGVQVGVGPVRIGYQQGYNYGYPVVPAYTYPAPLINGYAYPTPVAPGAPVVPAYSYSTAPVVIPSPPVVTGGYYYSRPYYPAYYGRGFRSYYHR